jgi:hypothetical protein
MAEQPTESLGTIYRVLYADGEAAFFTPQDYSRELAASQDPSRVPEHRMIYSAVFHDARFEPHYGGWWMLTGLSADGRRVDLADTTEAEISTLALSPAVARQLGISPDHGDFDVYYDPETGTASVQAKYGDRPDLGDAEAASPTERGRIQALADRIREWFQRDRDQGMGL